ncbi:MAG: hypothetical protein LAO77_25400, partial [Acidobacteriia bacterium]|nr:hypothetical protein [Terriglobia bacterium]
PRPSPTGARLQTSVNMSPMIAAIYARKSTDQSGVAEEQKSITRQVDSAGRQAIRLVFERFAAACSEQAAK